MEADESTMSVKPTRGRRWVLRLVKFIRYMIVFVVALVLLYIILDQIVWRQVVAQRAAFDERFGVAGEDSANPEQPSAEEEAGRYYRYAWSLIAKANDEYTSNDPYTALHDSSGLAELLGTDQPPTPEVVEAFVRDRLAAARPGLDVALEAARMRGGLLSPSSDPEATLQALAEARNLARYLSARAEIAARDGDVNEAFTYVFATLRLARTVGESRTILAQLVQIAIVGIAFDSSQRVLTYGEPATDIVAAITIESRNLRKPEQFVRALRGETIYVRDGLHLTMPRLWAGINELKMLETLTAMADAANTDDPNHRRELLTQAEVSAKQGPYLLYALVQVTAPAVLRSMDAWERGVSQTTVMEVGLAISQYHAEHGDYPEALDAAPPYLGGEVPSDPYTGTPLMYEKRGAGYVLYSVGPNLKDDGGAPLHGPGGVAGDVVWAIGQPEPHPIAEAEEAASTPRLQRLQGQQGLQGLFQRRGR
ncbi:MAG: hypothetical protein IT364_11460 [Candidatus Hydrogenedentes bacterium]|nr:hypothetical protein [Candidatus Hydrogenedentota bacterium]